MGGDELKSYFEDFLSKESFFKDKSVLNDSFLPDTITHRKDQISNIAKILAPCLRNEKASNIFIYGKTGTGKTLTVKHIGANLKAVSAERKLPLKFVYLNCKLKKVADTEYRLIAQLAREFGKSIPSTGLPTDEIYKIFFDALDAASQTIIIVLDEIDQLLSKTGDGVLYNLTRINSELKNCKVVLVGVSNDLMVTQYLDSRVRSSLSEEEVVFPPYNAIQIQDILRSRSRIAFNENTLQTGVVEKCAAYAAREHGDARRAIDLLRVAAEIAERAGEKQVEISHIDLAEEKIEQDRMLDATKSQPKQFQAILFSILNFNNEKFIFTGEVYEFYKKVCDRCNLRPLTQRRVSDVISELDMLGMITTRVISKGRYGRTREIAIATASSLTAKMKRILEEELELV